MNGVVLISGSGISGLLYALLLIQNNYDGKIMIVDKASEAGGLLRRFNYGEEYGDFDYGMHNFLETGIKDVDDLIYSLLPEDEWDVLDGNRRDLCGIYYNKTLQKKTPYIDIRNLPEAEYQSCLADFISHMNNNSSLEDETNCSAQEYMGRRFGDEVAKKVILPAVEKMHGKPASDLDYMATIFTPLTRIAFADEALSYEFAKSDRFRNLVAWGDQRTLPSDLSSGRRAYYPRNYGMYRVVDAMLERLKKAGVEILLNTEVTGVTHQDGKVSGVTLKKQDNSFQEISNIANLVWTSAPPLLARYLGIDCSDLGYDRAKRTIVVNMLLDEPLSGMEDLFYLFCYEPGFHTFRLTNFSGYCQGAVRNGLTPISIELLMDDQLAKETDLEKLAQDELKKFGVLSDSSRVVFAKAEFLDAGFPLPSRKNIASTKEIRRRINITELSNLEMIGILSTDNLFFQTDVMKYVHERVKIICKR